MPQRDWKPDRRAADALVFQHRDLEHCVTGQVGALAEEVDLGFFLRYLGDPFVHFAHERLATCSLRAAVVGILRAHFCSLNRSRHDERADRSSVAPAYREAGSLAEWGPDPRPPRRPLDGAPTPPAPAASTDGPAPTLTRTGRSRRKGAETSSAPPVASPQQATGERLVAQELRREHESEGRP